ncbi:hypothetical protein E3U43_017791 [Larimichthys crocea]|nr:hypothetical protein E3U43_017791 [Larimichthys crocea]
MDRRHRDLLDEVLPPEAKLRRAGFPVDVQQVFVSFKEVRPEQQEWSSSLDQGDPTEPTHIKEEEEEELWTSREQLQGVDEVKEEDGEKPRLLRVPITRSNPTGTSGLMRTCVMKV